METQFYARRRGIRSMRFDTPLPLARQAGELRVREGAIWLTRRNDLEDHLLRPGERIRLAADDAAVIEPWHQRQPALVEWLPAGRWSSSVGQLRTAAGHGLKSLAELATALAGALRRAEAGIAGRSN